MWKKVPSVNTITRILISGLMLGTTPISVAVQDNVRPNDYGNNDIAEDFVSAFYSWDATKLRNLMTENADVVAILYYQRWAEAANYKVKARRPCELEAKEIVCAITVTDDFGSAMDYEATDTFRLILTENKISVATFSGDDPPVFQELFRWIMKKRPDILAGPCLNMFAGGDTPGDCARAVARSAREFVDERGKAGS